MADYIDETYFFGSINIAGVDNSNTGNAELLTTFMTRYEREILICGLGVSLYNELQTALGVALGVPSALAEPWKSLVLGKEYNITVGGNTVKVIWDGIINETDLTSFLSFYTYWYWMQSAVNRQAYIATVSAAVENGVVVSPHGNMVRAWQDFIKLYGHCHYCNHGGRTFYCTHTNTEFAGNIERTLKEYIEDQNELVEDTFENWTWKPFANQNSFGI